MIKVLVFLFRLSFKVISKNLGAESLDFQSWAVSKEEIYHRMNRIVFRWVSAHRFTKNELAKGGGRQFSLEALHEILWNHYQYRVSLYFFLKKFKILSRNSFVWTSLFFSIGYVIRQFSLAAAKHFKRRILNADTFFRPVVLAIGFPEHAFTVRAKPYSRDSGDRAAFPLSFGEFFLDNCAGKDIPCLVSIDEYTRASRNIADKTATSENELIASLPRISCNMTFFDSDYPRRLSEFLMRFFTLVSSLALIRNGNRLLEILYFIYWARSYDYLRLMNSIGERIESIYALPIASPLGLLPHLSESQQKMVWYSYSQNVSEPPTVFLNRGRHCSPSWNCRTALADMSPDSWRISGRAVGFNDIFQYIDEAKKKLNIEYGFNLPVNEYPQPPEIPLSLGFENFSPHSGDCNSSYLITFDVPPEERRRFLARNFPGSPIYEHEAVEQFLSELVECCAKCDLKVYLKPKYSLNNYPVRYSNFLRSLQKKHPDLFNLLSPYDCIAPLLNSAAGAISMPYTSSKLVCEYAGMLSMYYMPEEYRSAFLSLSNLPDSKSTVLFGKDELMGFLQNTKKES